MENGAEVASREARQGASPAPSGPLVSADPHALPPELRLQILTTEHWSLLSTRSLTWNEAFNRAAMFLSAVSGAVIALAFVAGSPSLAGVFAWVALLLLPVVLFAGLSTFVRLVAINNEDDRWVVGMNRLRRAYLEAAPELAPYFVTGSTEDEAGMMTTFGARPGPGGLVHGFVTTPGFIALVDGVVAAALVAIASGQLGVATVVTIGLATGSGVVTFAVLIAYAFGRATTREADVRW